jgi:hypothetical protein
MTAFEPNLERTKYVTDVGLIRKKERKYTGNTHNVRLQEAAWGMRGAEEQRQRQRDIKL